MKTLLIILASLFPFAALGAVGYHDTQTATVEYRQGTTWEGDSAIFKYKRGGLSGQLSSKGELVGYYGGGNPGVIGFDCDGAQGPMIAMEESDLPVCKAVEPIANRKTYLTAA
jgi:hypothetical protein